MSPIVSSSDSSDISAGEGTHTAPFDRLQCKPRSKLSGADSTCPEPWECAGVSAAPCDTVVACPHCEQHMRTPPAPSSTPTGYTQKPYEPAGSSSTKSTAAAKKEEQPVLKFFDNCIDNCKGFTKGAYEGIKGAVTDKGAKYSELVGDKDSKSRDPNAVADSANPVTAAEIKELLKPHFQDWEIEAALKANNNRKIDAIKALIGVKPDENVQVQYYVPNHPPEYYKPHPEMGMAGGDRPRAFPGAKGWWEENTDQFGFKSGLLIGGLAGLTTGIILTGGL
eukprot:271639-Pyramimonas_sp.AAC.1